MSFLPINKKEMLERGWQQPDFVYVTGDAYVDHPSFGVAIISRLLEREGFRCVILSQPNFTSTTDFMQFGKPRLGFLVTSGNIDSMVAHYTAAKRKRSEDAYTPGNLAGKRPDRAPIVYSKLIREAYPDSPIVLGGLEVSLRRFAHYDYWDDAVRPSILVDSGADLLIYGMGEHPIVEIAKRMNAGEHPKEMNNLRGTCYLAPLDAPIPAGSVSCASFDKVSLDKMTYAKSTKIQLEQQDHVYGKTIIQKHGEQLVIQNPPSAPLTQAELDAVWELPFERAYHPSYEALGGVKAIEEVEFSIMHNRGCFGACNFCAITF
ncbi:MAG: YgiQ family radical SAM protein, partial [Angelakisella sp.]